MKKWLALLCLFLCMIPAALAEVEGDFEYRRLEDGSLEITGFAPGCTASELVIPAQLGGQPVSGIGSYAFSGCEDMVSLTLQEGIARIGEAAFSDTGLTDLHLPASVTELSAASFRSCPNLAAITLAQDHPAFSVKDGVLFDKAGETLIMYPAGRKGKAYTVPEEVLAIGSCAFDQPRNLTQVTLPKGLKVIGNEAFSNASISELTLPDSLKEIGSGAFNMCFGLKKLKLPKGVEIIHGNPLVNVSAKITVDQKNPVFAVKDGMLIDKKQGWLIRAPHQESACTVPEGIVYIADGAFNMSFVSSLTLPEGLEGIGAGAFENCTELARVDFPQGLKTIGDHAFSYCTGLKSVTFRQGLEEIGSSAFQSCTGLEELLLPDGLERIGSGAFENCSGLKELLLPDGLEKIGYRAFRNCTGLKEVVLPSSLEVFSSSAFEGCGAVIIDKRTNEEGL
ncbi:MAG: leucine-rich repeat domain-containing protein [Clostridia bacterium]|nr:leucine-rich repeat domain-containing protein [Clostridia bacterium]